MQNVKIENKSGGTPDSVKNNSIESTHIFAGNSRVATKMKVTTTGTTSTTPKELGIFYMHADHLGSSSTVTTKAGAFSEHNEYFPHGEVWISESVGDITLPFKFTGKELDVETGLYYYGARYMDPRLGLWYCTDPALGKYMPSADAEDENNLPGHGGVFNPVNLSLYHYAGNNPVKLTDPDGHATIAIEMNSNSITGSVALQVYKGNDGIKINFYKNWVTRGVNTSGQEVAIRSGVYQTKVSFFDNVGADSPRLQGSVSHNLKSQTVDGGHIPTIGPNNNHRGRNNRALNLVDGVRIHQMAPRAYNSPSHAGKPFIGSEGCQGPSTAGAWDIYKKEFGGNNEPAYLLIRPTEIKDNIFNWFKK